jgi:hypothetical protein
MQRAFVAVVASLVGLLPPAAANALVGVSNAAGTLSAVSPSKVTVAPVPITGSITGVVAGASGGALSCSLVSSSSVAGFKVGDLVAIDCDHGVLTTMSHVATRSSGRGTPLTGFPRTQSLPSAGPKVAAAQCAVAWNATTSSQERGALLRLHPLAAQVAEVNVMMLGANHSISAQGPECRITFVLPGARTVSVVGEWNHGTVPIWNAAVVPRFLSLAKAGFRVGSDGSLQRP